MEIKYWEKVEYVFIFKYYKYGEPRGYRCAITDFLDQMTNLENYHYISPLTDGRGNYIHEYVIMANRSFIGTIETDENERITKISITASPNHFGISSSHKYQKDSDDLLKIFIGKKMLFPGFR